jgi:hypothetical protein
MKKYIRVIRDEDLMDRASIGTLDGSRKWQNNIASCTATREYVSYHMDICGHIRPNYSGERRVADPLSELMRQTERGDVQT